MCLELRHSSQCNQMKEMKETCLAGTSLHQACLEHLAIGSHRHFSKCPRCSCTWGKTFWHGESKPEIGLNCCQCMPQPWTGGGWHAHGGGNPIPTTGIVLMYCILQYCIVLMYCSNPVWLS